MDMDFEAREGVSVAEHIRMIELKTASLFVGAVSMGATVGGASAAELEHLREFALQFGVAFQIQDDLLDSYGDQRLGKAVGGDILEGKKTFLHITAAAAIEAGSAGSAAADHTALADTHRDPALAPEQKIARVLDIYDRHGVRAATEKEIALRFAAATAALDALSGTVSAELLGELKEFAISQLYRTK
jgi:geranylgeranyl diphosphate synthase type II